MLYQLNRLLERIMPLLTPTSVVIGVLLASYLSHLAFLVPWIFAFMTFAGALSSNLKSLQKAITHPAPVLITLFLLHLLMPAWAWGVGHLVFQNDSLTITGLVLAMVIPTGITSFIWVSMKHGNIGLTLSIILVDTMISPFVVPYSLSLFVGGSIEMDIWNIMKGLLFMIVLPSLLGMVMNQWTKGKSKENLSPKLAPFSKLGLIAVVSINSAEVAPYLKDLNPRLVSIAAVAFVISFFGYLFAWGLGRLFRLNQEVIVAMIFTGGMRNISAGAVIAITFFPSEVAVPVVLGMLFQQILASIYGYFVDKTYHLPSIEQKYMA
jgi:bile acid:Na+ symporter, BASS family